MLHCFFYFIAMSRYLSFFSLSFNFSSVVRRSLRVVVSIYWHYLECWRDLLFLIFLARIVCLCYLTDVRLYDSSLLFSFYGPFDEVLLSSTSRMVPSVSRGGQPRCLSPWWDFCNKVWFWVVFSFSWDYHYYEFFTPVLMAGFSLKSEWQQTSPHFKDSSKYSSCS